jgi:hypothetical protein
VEHTTIPIGQRRVAEVAAEHRATLQPADRRFLDRRGRRAERATSRIPPAQVVEEPVQRGARCYQ